MHEPANIAAALVRMARQQPDAIALRCPGRRGRGGLARYDIALSYRELDVRSDAIAAGLARIGIVRGTRAVVMVRPGADFFALMFALFKAGAVPVLVDPGIDRHALKHCLGEAQPQAFIGIALAQWARRMLGWGRGHVRQCVSVGRLGFAGPSLATLERWGAGAAPQLADTMPDEVAAILFTSGSTGVPKGVVYRHRHFLAQIQMLGDAFGIAPGAVNLPTFPPFALFDPAIGSTSVIPDMDPTRPARADPRKLHDAIARFAVTDLFGSPALMAVLARHGQPLPGLRRVMSAGAPVPAAVVARLRELLPEDARLWTPYGATECLPVAVIEGGELQATRAATETGSGTCVGRPVPPNTVRIIRIRDDAIADWREVQLVQPGEVGEITVAGPSVTDSYFNRPAATALAKICERLADGSERMVHRMGDLGWFDRDGRLWFCGRKTQRVQCVDGPLYTEQVEPVFNTHPEVLRTALVGIGKAGAQQPVLCVELRARQPRSAHSRIRGELLVIGGRHVHSARVQRIVFHPGFPVDIRHNAKIGREALARWVAKQRT
ncbi:MAG: fatty acid CoA ligase family protein [Xanthomonadaceae bacterium]|nr:fatty acid CoA ligase family protein [Xanthomonadaceae bacterium]MDP2187026.1 fatty acid CoA ligase family protein [Xanthomonadales bacterium]MDZ4115445.1 fatty acid CoA ligase family protein [Xanthomonadaceae bacterium]MDZ4378489.1 fatty acid CoA ligase family protein [Xanthomonadaceae bacterium]